MLKHVIYIVYNYKLKYLNMSVLQIERVKVNELISFTKKLLPIDKFIYLKIKQDVKDPIVVSTCYLPERDAVKVQQVPLSELLEGVTDSNSSIIVTFFNGNNVIDALKHFANGSVRGELTYDKFGTNLVATNLKLISDDLTISLPCCDPSLGLQDLTVDQVKAIFSTKGELFTFNVDSFSLDKLSSLFNLEKEIETFNICIDQSGVRFKGNVYDNLVTQESVADSKQEVLFYKKYLPLLDKESYAVSICPNKAVFRSIDTNTLLTIATTQA